MTATDGPVQIRCHMTLPNEVRVGPLVYALDRAQAGVLDGDSGNVGHTDHHAARILVLAGMDQLMERVTVLHEVLHAVFTVTGAAHLCPTDEETLVETIDAALLGVLRDNPALVAYLTTPEV